MYPFLALLGSCRSSRSSSFVGALVLGWVSVVAWNFISVKTKTNEEPPIFFEVNSAENWWRAKLTTIEFSNKHEISKCLKIITVHFNSIQMFQDCEDNQKSMFENWVTKLHFVIHAAAECGGIILLFNETIASCRFHLFLLPCGSATGYCHCHLSEYAETPPLGRFRPPFPWEVGEEMAIKAYISRMHGVCPWTGGREELKNRRKHVG